MLINEIITLLLEFAINLILICDQSLNILGQLIQIILDNFIFFGYLGLNNVKHFSNLVVLKCGGLFAGGEDDDLEAF